MVDEPAPDGIKLICIVQYNPRLAELTFRGNSKFSDQELQKRIESKSGGWFNERRLFLDRQRIQEMYEQAGYKGTEVKYSYEVDEKTGKAKATFAITEDRG